MRQDYTHVVFLLDRSGSMASCKDDVIGGFKTFIESQQKDPGYTTLTLIQFDDKYEVNCGFKNVKDVFPLTKETFEPRGSTALLDAFCRAIDDTGDALNHMREYHKPAKVLFVVYTDGEENASHKFKLKDLQDKIVTQRDTYNWKFIYLGANQDAIATASKYGIDTHSTLNFSSANNAAAFRSAGKIVTNYKVATMDVFNSSDANVVCGFSKEDREENKS